MAESPHVTKETVAHMAREVAGIELSAEEVEQLTPQLNRMLSDLAQIPDAELQDLEPPLFFDAGQP